MKKTKKTFSDVKKVGAMPLKNFSPFDHNEPGTPVAVNLTPAPHPPAQLFEYAQKKKGGNPKIKAKSTATTEHGRSGDDAKKTARPKKQSGAKSSRPNPQNLQSRFDPNGSYTGVPSPPAERPSQDADDL